MTNGKNVYPILLVLHEAEDILKCLKRREKQLLADSKNHKTGEVKYETADKSKNQR